jgi:hypothetical protein
MFYCPVSNVRASGRGQAVWSPANSGRGSVGICSRQSFISWSLCGLLERNPEYTLGQARRNTGDSDSSTKELTCGLVNTASIRSTIASFPRPNSVTLIHGTA